MAARKTRFSLTRLVSKILKFVRDNHVTSEKVELYLYRTIIFLITLVHLVKFLWFTVSH